jgi:hypothetical protein
MELGRWPGLSKKLHCARVNGLVCLLVVVIVNGVVLDVLLWQVCRLASGCFSFSSIALYVPLA